MFGVIDDTVMTYLSKTGISMLPRAPPDMKIPLAMPRLEDKILRPKNLPPLVEVSLNSDIALDKDKATPHPAHHGEPHQEPDGNFCKALQGKTSQRDFVGAI